jgi:hypothetical protein
MRYIPGADLNVRSWKQAAGLFYMAFGCEDRNARIADIVEASKNDLHLRPHAADAAVGVIAI